MNEVHMKLITYVKNINQLLVKMQYKILANPLRLPNFKNF